MTAERKDGADGWTLEFFEDENKKQPCREWMENDLGDLQHDALVEALAHVLGRLGPEVCRTEWGKALGGGLYEFRIRHTAAEINSMFGGAPPGLKKGQKVLVRVFFHVYGQKVVLLLGGYDKGKDAGARRQQKEIETARKRLAIFKKSQLAKRRAVPND